MRVPLFTGFRVYFLVLDLVIASGFSVYSDSRACCERAL